MSILCRRLLVASCRSRVVLMTTALAVFKERQKNCIHLSSLSPEQRNVRIVRKQNMKPTTGDIKRYERATEWCTIFFIAFM